MDLQHLVMFVNTYDLHFKQNSNRRKNKAIQITPNGMWKKMYDIYILANLDNVLQEDTLKECLQDYLKEVKTRRSNPNGGLSACM